MPVGIKDISYQIVVNALQDPSVQKVFGRVSADIMRTSEEIERLKDQQRDLNSEIRRLRKAKEPYEHLEAQLKDVERELGDVTDKLAKQQDQWIKLQRRTEEWGDRAKWAIGILAGLASGAAYSTIELGEYAKTLQEATNITGIASSEIDRFYKTMSREFNLDIESDSLIDFAEGIREAREGVEDIRAAYQRLGFDPDQIGAEDFGLLLDRLRAVPDVIERVRLAQLTLGEEASSLALSYAAMTDEQIKMHKEQSVLTEQQIKGLAEVHTSWQEVQGALREVRAEIGEALGPSFITLFENIAMATSGFAEFLNEHEQAVPIFLGVAAALVTLIAGIWALNAALGAMQIIMSAGAASAWVLPALAIAGVGLAAGAGVATYLGSQIDEQERDLERRRNEDTAKTVVDGLGPKIEHGAEETVDALSDKDERDQKTLRAIQKAAECADALAKVALDQTKPTIPPHIIEPWPGYFEQAMGAPLPVREEFSNVIGNPLLDQYSQPAAPTDTPEFTMPDFSTPPFGEQSSYDQRDFSEQNTDQRDFSEQNTFDLSRYSEQNTDQRDFSQNTDQRDFSAQYFSEQQEHLLYDLRQTNDQRQFINTTNNSYMQQNMSQPDNQPQINNPTYDQRKEFTFYQEFNITEDADARIAEELEYQLRYTLNNVG